MFGGEAVLTPILSTKLFIPELRDNCIMRRSLVNKLYVASYIMA